MIYLTFPVMTKGIVILWCTKNEIKVEGRVSENIGPYGAHYVYRLICKCYGDT